ncbi:hypothetical protein K8R43_03670 [archaeon]|nr:hypothetical protein [archaeon]
MLEELFEKNDKKLARLLNMVLVGSFLLVFLLSTWFFAIQDKANASFISENENRTPQHGGGGFFALVYLMGILLSVLTGAAGISLALAHLITSKVEMIVFKKWYKKDFDFFSVNSWLMNILTLVPSLIMYLISIALILSLTAHHLPGNEWDILSVLLIIALMLGSVVFSVLICPMSILFVFFMVFLIREKTIYLKKKTEIKLSDKDYLKITVLGIVTFGISFSILFIITTILLGISSALVIFGEVPDAYIALFTVLFL